MTTFSELFPAGVARVFIRGHASLGRRARPRRARPPAPTPPAVDARAGPPRRARTVAIRHGARRAVSGGEEGAKRSRPPRGPRRGGGRRPRPRRAPAPRRRRGGRPPRRAPPRRRGERGGGRDSRRAPRRVRVHPRRERGRVRAPPRAPASSSSSRATPPPPSRRPQPRASLPAIPDVRAPPFPVPPPAMYHPYAFAPVAGMPSRSAARPRPRPRRCPGGRPRRLRLAPGPSRPSTASAAGSPSVRRPPPRGCGSPSAPATSPAGGRARHPPSPTPRLLRGRRPRRAPTPNDTARTSSRRGRAPRTSSGTEHVRRRSPRAVPDAARELVALKAAHVERHALPAAPAVRPQNSPPDARALRRVPVRRHRRGSPLGFFRRAAEGPPGVGGITDASAPLDRGGGQGAPGGGSRGPARGVLFPVVRRGRGRGPRAREGVPREVGLPAVRGDLLGQDQRGDDGEEGPRAAPGRVGPPRSGPDEGTLPRRDRGVAAAQRGRAPRARQHRHGRHRRRARARGRGGRTSSGAIEEARGAPRRRRAVRAGEAEAARVRGRPGREARVGLDRAGDCAKRFRSRQVRGGARRRRRGRGAERRATATAEARAERTRFRDTRESSRSGRGRRRSREAERRGRETEPRGARDEARGRRREFLLLSPTSFLLLSLPRSPSFLPAPSVLVQSVSPPHPL